MSTAKVPATIVTGFLGSGKTTIINHWIDELQAQGQQVVYIKNEIGDTDLDGKLLQAKGVKAKELLNGCICCTLVGPFTSSITDAVEQFHPDRIIVEASGTADTAALALMISAHPLLWREAVVSIIDVLNFEGFADLSHTAQAQTKFTDLLIFNKVELADQAQKERVVGYVRELNQHSPIIESHQGKVPLQVAFGLSHRELDMLLADHPHDEQAHDHETEDQIQGVTLDPAPDWTQEQWSEWLEKLPMTVFRVKGVLEVEGQKYLLNRVNKRTDWRVLESSESELLPVLIVIGYQVSQLDSSSFAPLHIHLQNSL